MFALSTCCQTATTVFARLSPPLGHPTSNHLQQQTSSRHLHHETPTNITTPDITDIGCPKPNIRPSKTCTMHNPTVTATIRTLPSTTAPICGIYIHKKIRIFRICILYNTVEYSLRLLTFFQSLTFDRPRGWILTFIQLLTLNGSKYTTSRLNEVRSITRPRTPRDDRYEPHFYIRIALSSNGVTDRRPNERKPRLIEMRILVKIVLLIRDEVLLPYIHGSLASLSRVFP